MMSFIACIASASLGFLVAMKAAGVKRAPLGYLLLAAGIGFFIGGLETIGWLWLLTP